MLRTQPSPQGLPESGPRLHIADRLNALNKDIRVVNPDFHIDPGAMLVLSLGNPTHFRFAVEGEARDVSFRISQVDTQVANARLYRDPMRGGGYFRPDVEPEFRNLGIGILSYLTAGRIALLLWGEELHSNAQQLSPSAEGVWNALCSQRLAIKRGNKDFSLLRAVAESESSGALLGTLLKMRKNEDIIATSSHFKLPQVDPEDLRAGFFGKDTRPYEYWLDTKAGRERRFAQSKSAKR